MLYSYGYINIFKTKDSHNMQEYYPEFMNIYINIHIHILKFLNVVKNFYLKL